jgi:hypothetical protein
VPIYIFKHPKKGKYIEVVQKMNDEHKYTDEKGVEWERVYTVPQAAVKEGLDHRNPNTFVNATKNMKGNLGDITDLSQELSDKRANESDSGRDPLKDKFFDKWSEKRKGKVHPEDNRKKKNGTHIV